MGLLLLHMLCISMKNRFSYLKLLNSLWFLSALFDTFFDIYRYRSCVCISAITSLITNFDILKFALSAYGVDIIDFYVAHK